MTLLNNRANVRIRVLVADGQPVVREGLRAMLALRAECEVAGEAADGEEAIDRYQSLRPDVTILDLRLPKLGGIEAIAAMRALDPDARIVALTFYGADAEVQRALDAGAMGLLPKAARAPEIVEAVHRVHAGRPYLAAELEEELLQSRRRPALTTREVEVLALLAEGLRNQQIARALRLSLNTVKVHVNHILEKLGAQDRTEAVTRALRRGVISLR
jgi:two-component system NarL family response regulator